MEEDSEEQEFKPAKEKVYLAKDVYGTFLTNKDERVKVYRFTWYSHNRIQVQVITYGARIIAMKAPCRNGVVEDIVMSFDKLSDFINRDSNTFGATIGRYCSLIEKATYVINGKQVFLEKNHNNKHHINGGTHGFDQKMFTPHVEGKKLILSYISEDGEENYPGALFLRITYELSTKNEFSVNMEAFSTRETIINLSNCLYFNLAGHSAGLKEMRRHYLTVNSNCYTVKRKDGLPTGEIRSVINTRLNFQIPTLANNICKLEKFNECLCVNRSIDQGDCFVASLFHPPSGRHLEIYSNQPGVNISLPNNFGVGVIRDSKEARQKRIDDIFDILKVIHSRAEQLFENNDPGDLEVVRDLTVKLGNRVKRKTEVELNEEQVEYLKVIKDAVVAVEHVPVFAEIVGLINSILPEQQDEDEEERKKSTSSSAEERIQQKSNTSNSPISPPPVRQLCSPDTRFVGKNGAIYVNNGAICIQTENYPNAVYHKNFPNCVLKPGEMYRHTIVYKFWVRAGRPAKWMRRTNKQFRKEGLE